jgi:hypothetical protein
MATSYITPSEANSVKKTGGTMTGNLVFDNGNGVGAEFKGGSGAPTIDVYNNGTQTEIKQKASGSTGSDIYKLPSVSSQASDANYSILTSKAAVTVAQGGTGATTAANARTNLGAVNKAGDTMTGTLNATQLRAYDSTTPMVAFVSAASDATAFGAVWEKLSSRRLVLRQRHSNGHNEDYYLPTNTASSADGTYSILTDKALDANPTNGSANPVKSGGVYTALSGKVNTSDVTTSVTNGGTKVITAGGVYTALGNRTSITTGAPASGGDKLITNGQVYTALGNRTKIETAAPASGGTKLLTNGDAYTALAGKMDTKTIDSAPTSGHTTQLVYSGGVYTAVHANDGATFTPSSFTVSASASRFAVHNGSMCTVEYFSTAVSGSNIRNGTTLFTLPSGKRPKAVTYAPCVFANDNQSMSAGLTPLLGTVKLNTDGVVSVYHYNSASTDLSYHVMLNCSYSIV